MKQNKEFMETYTAKKGKKAMRSLIYKLIIICNIMNLLALGIYKIAIGINVSLVSNEQMVLAMVINYFIIMIPFNLISLILYIFLERLERLMDLYISITLIGCSILYFCVSMLIFAHKLNILEVLIVIIISIIVYVCLIFTIVGSVKNKMRNGFRKVKVDKKLVSSFIALCGALGIIIAKTTKADDLIPAIALLILSYSFTPAITGFHKFYLKFKKNKKLSG